MERAIEPTPDRSAGQAEQVLAATIVTRKEETLLRLRSQAYACE